MKIILSIFSLILTTSATQSVWLSWVQETSDKQHVLVRISNDPRELNDKNVSERIIKNKETYDKSGIYKITKSKPTLIWDIDFNRPEFSYPHLMKVSSNAEHIITLHGGYIYIYTKGELLSKIHIKQQINFREIKSWLINKTKINEHQILDEENEIFTLRTDYNLAKISIDLNTGKVIKQNYMNESLIIIFILIIITFIFLKIKKNRTIRST